MFAVRAEHRTIKPIGAIFLFIHYQKVCFSPHPDVSEMPSVRAESCCRSIKIEFRNRVPGRTLDSIHNHDPFPTSQDSAGKPTPVGTEKRPEGITQWCFYEMLQGGSDSLRLKNFLS